MKKLGRMVFVFVIAAGFFPRPLAAAKTYFYKEVGKPLKGQKYDYYYVTKDRKNPTDLSIVFYLPKKVSKTSNRMWISLTCGTGAADDGRRQVYKFFIERIAVRTRAKNYPLEFDAHFKNLNMAPRSSLINYQKTFSVAIDKGALRSKYEVEISPEETFHQQFFFDIHPLPSALYLDYKFRVRTQDGKQQSMEGSIAMELVSSGFGW